MKGSRLKRGKGCSWEMCTTRRSSVTSTTIMRPRRRNPDSHDQNLVTSELPELGTDSNSDQEAARVWGSSTWIGSGRKVARYGAQLVTCWAEESDGFRGRVARPSRSRVLGGTQTRIRGRRAVGLIKGEAHQKRSQPELRREDWIREREIVEGGWQHWIFLINDLQKKYPFHI